jgi:hypothetical protein
MPRTQQIVLSLTSDEVEEVMFALKLRAVQKGAPIESKATMERIRQQLEAEGILRFGWAELRPDNQRWQIKDDIRCHVQMRQRW